MIAYSQAHYVQVDNFVVFLRNLQIYTFLEIVLYRQSEMNVSNLSDVYVGHFLFSKWPT